MPRDVEMMRVLEPGGVVVCDRDESGNYIAAMELPGEIASHEARFCHLDRRYVAQALFYAGRRIK